MRALMICNNGHTWSCRGISEPDVGIWCMPDDRDVDSGTCPECGSIEVDQTGSDYDDEGYSLGDDL